MRKLLVTMWVSLDGYVSGPNDDMGFVGQFYDDAMGNYETAIVSAADTIMLGRITYESFAGSWPKVPDNPNVSEGEREYARQLNAMHKVVFSRSLDKAEWNNTELFKDIVPADVEKLKKGVGKDIAIYGSTSIVQQLTNLGLIDEYQILIHPIILGSGKPLFKDIKKQIKLRLVGQKTHSSGVVLLTYKPRTA